MPEAIAELVQAHHLVLDDVAVRIQIARIEQLAMFVSRRATIQLRRELDMSEDGAEGDMGFIIQPGATPDRDP